MAAAVLLLSALAADAGQRRVDVGFGGNNFVPQFDTPLNNGDHVTFVWAGGGHTATSGTDPGDPNAGSLFDSGFLSGAGQAFTWKANQTGTIPFYCDPHVGFGMTGSLAISASDVSVSDFRISEVQYNAVGGLDRIEIANLGSDAGNLGRYRIAINGSTSVPVPLGSVIVLSGGRVVIHTNEGTSGSTQTNLFMGGIGDLPTTGSVALYAPNTQPGTTLLDFTQIVDFVQWGAGGQANSVTAFAGAVWVDATDFVPAVPAAGNYDIVFCATVSDPRNSFNWKVAHPNFGSGVLCSTPTRASTWGRIKVLYR